MNAYVFETKVIFSLTDVPSYSRRCLFKLSSIDLLSRYPSDWLLIGCDSYASSICEVFSCSISSDDGLTYIYGLSVSDIVSMPYIF